jgi:hypothetical protein
MKPACSTLFSSFYGERNYEAIRRFNQGAIFWQKRKKIHAQKPAVEGPELSVAGSFPSSSR